MASRVHDRPAAEAGGGSDRVQTLDDATFAGAVAAARGPAVVEFMSYGCEHCRAMEPVLQGLAQTSEMTFFRVNVAAEPDLAERLQIDVTPTFVMFRDGREVGREAGVRPVRSRLAAALARPFA